MADEEVHNITDVLPGHNHAGVATYAGYAHGCRAADCRTAFYEYQAKLAERKRRGEYLDLRYRENQVTLLMGEALERINSERDVQAGGRAEAAPVPGTPSTDKPLLALPGTTLLDCLAGIVDEDGTFTRARFVDHAAGFCARLGIQLHEIGPRLGELIGLGQVQILDLSGVYRVVAA